MILSLLSESQKGCQISPLRSHDPVRKQVCRIAPGTDIRCMDLICRDSCLPEHDLVCPPQIHLILSVWFLVKQIVMVLLCKAIGKFRSHLRSYLKAVLEILGPMQAMTSAGSVPYSRFMASSVAFPMRCTVPLQPEWDSPTALWTGSTKYSGTQSA